MESVFRREVWGFMQLPVSAENEQAMCESMIAGCEAAVASYPTSLADDIRQLAELNKGEQSPRALALHVRMVRIQLIPEMLELEANMLTLHQFVFAAEFAGNWEW
jgi:hypothetical protein